MTAADTDYLRRLHALESELVAHVPYHDGQVDAPHFETWLKGFEENPDLLPEANLVAVDGEKLVGMTNLWASQATDRILYTGFTGVLPAYRRRGIATALKVRALTFAKGHLSSAGEAPLVRTGNEESNPMLQINLRLGFLHRPADLVYLKELT
jgi:GNAT superfamily N-acetyltransferase